MMRRGKSAPMMSSFMCGAIVGGVLALLFAPKSGAETREMLREFVEDEIDMIKDRSAAAREYVSDEMRKYKNKAHQAAENFGDMVDDVKQGIAEEKDKLADRL